MDEEAMIEAFGSLVEPSANGVTFARYPRMEIRHGHLVPTLREVRSRFDQYPPAPSGFSDRFTTFSELTGALSRISGAFSGSHRVAKFHVYIVQAAIGGPIKIGYTRSVRHRFVGLNASSPFPLTLVDSKQVIRPRMDIEIHECLPPSDHSHLEWWLPTPDVIWCLQRLGFELQSLKPARPITACPAFQPREGE